MQIDIYSDTICPWCYVGKRRLERAQAMAIGPAVTFRWRAFQLNPDMPQAGMDRQRYLEAKFGGQQNAQRVYDAVRQAGEAEGIAFAFEAIERTPNTIQSHRLVRFAEEHGLSDALVEVLFRFYFLEGKDVGDDAVLAEAGAAVGLQRDQVQAFLAADGLRDEVEAEDANARNAGIQGVPCFVVNGKYALAGAHPPEVLGRLFELAREDGHSAGDAATTGT